MVKKDKQEYEYDVRCWDIGVSKLLSSRQFKRVEGALTHVERQIRKEEIHCIIIGKYPKGTLISHNKFLGISID